MRTLSTRLVVVLLLSPAAFPLGCGSSSDDTTAPGSSAGAAGGGAGTGGGGGAPAAGAGGGGTAGKSGGAAGKAGGTSGHGGTASAGQSGSGGAGHSGSAGAPAGGQGGSAGGAGSGTGGASGGPIVTMPTNVLNNGGFELGLMCYGQYEWGSDPSQPGTGYRFSLSSDAHGGGHALQIACVNQAECGFPAKAAVQATPFHTPHSQSYKVSVYSKCTAGDLAFFYSPSSDKGDFSANFACTGDWAPNDFTFTSSATGDYVAYSLYNAGKNTLLLDDLVITYGDGTVPTHTIKHPGQRPSAATASGFTVDGKPFLPLGFYQVPAEQLTKAKQMGVNAIAWGDPGCANTDADAYADLAYEAGITLVPESSTTARLGAPEVFPAVLQAFGGHLANIAWYLDDEPDLDAWVWQPVTPDALTAAYTQIHAASPLPVGVMLQRSHYDSPALDQPYAPAMDVYLSEPYGSSFDGITHTATVFATMPKKPVWLAEDDSLDPALIVPKAYFGFTSGATGLFYFTWSGLEADGKLDAAAQAITELSSLSDVLNGADAGATVTAPPGISWIARTNGTKTTILAVNPAAADVTGDFTVQGLPAGKSVTVQFESRSVTSAAGAFGDTFAGVSRHVYVIE